MTTMVNTTSNRTLNIGGQTLPPRGIAHTDASATKLAEHLFVRAGLVEISGAPSKPASSGPSAKERADEAAQSDDMERLQELAKDTAKSVREAAEFRIAELEDEKAGQ